MLTLKDLTALETRLKSGQVEIDFKYGTEQERVEILEFLEKIMDLADLADEVATRLIFRGLQAQDMAAGRE